jgi:hypothetical protein
MSESEQSRKIQKQRGSKEHGFPLSSGKATQDANFAKEPQGAHEPENGQTRGGPENDPEIPRGSEGGSCLGGLAYIPLCASNHVP